LYNLETVDNYYLASNIQKDNDNNEFLIAHNCRCTLSMRFEDFPPKTRRRAEDKKVIPYQTYNEWAEARK